MPSLLEIKGLCASAEEKQILNGLDLTVEPGETHVLLGPNGAGKSTLGSVIMGSPEYRVTAGSIRFEGADITAETTDQRARRGLFLSFQTPEEVPGVTLADFLRVSRAAVTGRPLKVFAFQRELKEMMRELGMDESYAERSLNVGFSGGEKKKSEILQLLMLQPKLAILDETDSGLDVDAVRIVSEGIRRYRNGRNALLIITHGARLLEGLSVDRVHILADGRIIRSGGSELIGEVETNGFRGIEAGAGL